MLYIAGGFFFIWLVILSWIVFNVRRHYQNLVSRTKKERIDAILDELLNADKKINVDVEELKRRLTDQVRRSELHLQKVGLIRFNPFDRTGGEQSFVIALLDMKNNGIIINFIYTREGLRAYTKKVKEGKGDEYELSEEEKKAIEKSN